MNTDVVVAGAGPVGLLLAAELKLAGISVIVLERLTEPSRVMKAGAVNGRSTQALARRGLRPRLEAESAKYDSGFAAFIRHHANQEPGAPLRNRFDGHFGGLFLQADPDLDLPDSVMIPQYALEDVLGEWVAELGIQVLRGHELTDFTQDADGVTVHTAGDHTLRAGYLVGCDGAHSTVRKLAGIEFPGVDPVITGLQAVATLDHPERLTIGWNFTVAGLYVARGTNPERIMTVEFDGPPADRTAEITQEEVQASLRRVSGADVTILSMETATRYTDNNRQAAQYRKGRVLLAGDATHVHAPFGGQGLNLGLQDVANLGWKLAATIHGWAPAGLLDTYQVERHPVAARVLANTRAQVAIMRRDPHSQAMRDILGEMLKIPAATEWLVRQMQGLNIQYDLGPATNPLTGRHAPEIPGIEDALRLPRPALFDPSDSPKLREAMDGWTDRVDVHTLPDSGLTALLVRPDGYVAWAAEGETDATDLDTLRQTLTRWFGTPTR